MKKIFILLLFITTFSTIYSKSEVENIIEQGKLKVSPNLVEADLFINAQENRDYYQLYTISGQIVRKGKFVDKKINLSNLLSGIYMIRINDSDEVFKIIQNY